MIVLDSGKYADAVTVIKENGFVDITPDVSLVTHKLFEKGGKLYAFNGWNRLDERRHWNGVNMVEVKVVPVHQEDLKKWVGRGGL